jgi:hypothetical protein
VVRREHVRLEYGDYVVRSLSRFFCSYKLYEMSAPDLKEMRAQLRALRKENMKPVSRMRKADISAELNALGQHLAETPTAGKGSPEVTRQSRSSVETIKEAKAQEFPVAPAKDNKQAKSLKMPASHAKMSPAEHAKVMKKEMPVTLKKKPSKLATLMRLLEADSSDDE